MKNLIRLSAFIIILFLLNSCDSSNDSPNPNPAPNTTTFTTTLSGIREEQPNNSTATGSATLVFNNTTKIFTITVTHNVASPTGGHIHKGVIGVSGPIVFPFDNLTSPISYTSPVLTAAQEADLKAELYYVNIHTATYPAGEIRGQLFRQGTGGGSY